MPTLLGMVKSGTAAKWTVPNALVCTMVERTERDNDTESVVEPALKADGFTACEQVPKGRLGELKTVQDEE